MSEFVDVKLLQKSVKSSPSWVGVCRELNKRGINAEQSVIADLFTEDVCQEYYLLITQSGEIYEFYYDWLSSGDRMHGEIIEWNDFTDNPEGAYMQEPLKCALKYMDNLFVR